MILKELSKHDEKWREIALNITKGDKDLADDLTQQMYLKLMNYEKFNVYFVAVTLKNLYLDTFKSKKLCSLDSLHYLRSNESDFQPNDRQQEVLDKANDLKWYQIELLKESYDNSNRSIGEKYNMNYGFVHREIHKAVKEILGENYTEKYKNSNLKYKKNEK